MNQYLYNFSVDKAYLGFFTISELIFRVLIATRTYHELQQRFRNEKLGEIQDRIGSKPPKNEPNLNSGEK